MLTESESSLETARDAAQRITTELSRAIVGQEAIVAALMASILARGHCLLIGVPGLAKTLLVQSIARVLGLDFSRIQFTPDLMPADILGSEVIHEVQGRMEFEYRRGPVFANLVLADEINRTPPKTQAALLEAMQERRVTLAGETHELPNPFLVVATQNPIEHEGTYPLPEAQLDRFMFSLDLGYPNRQEEIEVVRRTTIGDFPELQPAVGPAEVRAMQKLVRAMPVADHVLAYAVDIAKATRPGEDSPSPTAVNYLEWGAGPRASQYLVLGAKAMALLQGRAAPACSDLRAVATSVLAHRIVPNYRATGEGLKASRLAAAIVNEVPEPRY
ncbi:MoxR-like ATPase [Haloferula luteola]|uniref:MoxR-like ATPase n=1 Tax=Haloferula luteola TaxID=595692 RepID=A0A840VC40_9BACT|nr:AAA family ATPase [Haloferula luteola]MBB5351490.1 MoxR-like ATPase [Haloferula luteola]